MTRVLRSVFASPQVIINISAMLCLTGYVVTSLKHQREFTENLIQSYNESIQSKISEIKDINTSRVNEVLNDDVWLQKLETEIRSRSYRVQDKILQKRLKERFDILLQEAIVAIVDEKDGSVKIATESKNPESITSTPVNII